MNCDFNNPVDINLDPATPSASPSGAWAFHSANCYLTSSASATLSGTLNDFNNSMHNYVYTLFLCLGILIFIAAFWIGQWLFRR
jgi:hypothetical protein